MLTTTDSDNDVPGSKAQNDNSIFGKVIFINLNNGNYNIFSKGHRNAQGLAVKNNIIISTEHGPRVETKLIELFMVKIMDGQSHRMAILMKKKN